MTSWWLPVASWNAFGSSVANHLWQTTLFVIAAAVMARLVGPRYPSIRHSIWLIASVKFLVPFSVLVSAGHALARWSQPILVVPAMPAGLQTISQPFSAWAVVPPANAFDPARLAVPGLVAIWLAGCAVALGVRWIRWRQIAAAVARVPALASGREMDALGRVLARSRHVRPVTIHEIVTPREPGLFGVRRPRLLWPAGLSPRLSDEAIDAIVAHEICHLRRGDNLTSLVHTLVEAVFWFHPMVWWLGARLVDDREHACDQEVLSFGTRPETYAESLLNVCRFSLRSPLPFVAGITGSHLSQRVEAIMTYRVRPALNPGRRVLLVAVAMLVVAGPVATGLIGAPSYEIPLAASPAWTRGATLPVRVPAIARPSLAGRLPTARQEPPPPATLPAAAPQAAPQVAPQRDAPPAPALRDDAYRSRGIRAIKTVDPTYTSAARSAKIEGTVELEVEVLESGTVGAVRITKSLDKIYGLDEQAIIAARQWLFSAPLNQQGQPQRAIVMLILDFRLTRLKGGLVPIKMVDPTYTSEAMRAKIQGKVQLEVLVLENGTVGDVHIIRSLDRNYGLDQKAIEAAKQWVFQVPLDPEGKPRRAIETLVLEFRLY